MNAHFDFGRRGLIAAVALVILGQLPSSDLARAQEEAFPSKTIEVVIHSKYGGGTDTTARMMMIRTRRGLGVDMAVVAKRGGSGAKARSWSSRRGRNPAMEARWRSCPHDSSSIR